MRRRLGSIKFRIVAVVVVFTLASTLASAALSLRHFQRSARENLLRAAEFNLNLVAGLVSRDMESLASLRDWCGMDAGVSGYISGAVTGADAAVRAFETMNEQVRPSRAYPYLLRVVAVSQDYQRILQCGSGTTAGIPLNPYTINRLERLEQDLDGRQWVATDPFTTVDAPCILYSCGPIHQGSGRGRPTVGTVFLMVSSAIITDPVADYQLPEDCSLLLTVNGQSFVLDGAGTLTAADSSGSYTPTQDETFNSSTLVNQFPAEGGALFLSVSCPVGGRGCGSPRPSPPRP